MTVAHPSALVHKFLKVIIHQKPVKGEFTASCFCKTYNRELYHSVILLSKKTDFTVQSSAFWKDVYFNHFGLLFLYNWTLKQNSKIQASSCFLSSFFLHLSHYSLSFCICYLLLCVQRWANDSNIPRLALSPKHSNILSQEPGLANSLSDTL